MKKNLQLAFPLFLQPIPLRFLPCTALFFLLCLLLSSASAPAQSLPPRISRSIDSTFRVNYPASGPGCVVLIAEEGHPVFKKAYGLASVELNIPDHTGDVFAIGSMTKQFTALAMAQLQQAGKVSFADDIRKYLPGYNTHGSTITISNLLSHTSGIPDFIKLPAFWQNYTRDCSAKEQLAVFENDSLLFQPGSDWKYSNSGYLLAALIIEKVSGIPYEDYVQKNIFTPLGMTHTCFGTHEKIIPRLVNGYDPADSSHMKPGMYFSWTWASSAGGILSTVDDLLKWDEALYSDKLLSPAAIKEIFTPFILTTGKSAEYGYGWFINDDRGVTVISHGGYVAGYMCQAIRIPAKHLYALVLSNSTRVLPESILLPLVSAMNGTPAKDTGHR